MSAEAGGAAVNGLTLAGGGTLLALLGAFARGLFTGTTSQEKDIRETLLTRVEKLEGRVETLEQENERYRQAAITEQRRYLYLLGDRERIRRERDALRVEVNALRQDCGKAHHAWELDPADPGSF